MVVTKRVIVPRTPAIGKGNDGGDKDARGYVRMGWDMRGAKDSTFFQGLSQSSSLECNVRGLPTSFGYLSETKKKIELELCQRMTKEKRRSG
jgi:hypothetical protein